MGLLDSLMYNSSGYGGQGGGLLDFLRTTQMQNDQYQPSAGFPQPPQDQASPMQIGGYQMPRMGNPDQFQPQQAMTPPNATPTQGQFQQPPMNGTQQPAFGPQGEGSFTTGLRALGNPGGLINKVADAVQGFSTGQSPTQRQQAQLFQAYVGAGLTPQQAYVAVLNPHLAGNMMGGGQTDDIKEYQFAKKEDPSLTFANFMLKKKATSGEYGMQPIWGTGPDGKPAVLQLGKSGDAKQSVLPPGFNLSRDPIKVEGPTGTTIIDPQTRQQVAFIPKDVAGAAKSKEIGEAEGQATVNLPTTIATAENTLKTIKQLEEHPGKKSWGAFGVGAMLPDIPGTDTRGFAALVDQVKGQNFMTAFQSLKGAGAITEAEGTKAERAQARLDRAQSEKDFDVALKDLKEVVVAGMERARQKAGIKNNQQLPAQNNDLKKKYGLD
jgi:hypothetical protein